MTVCVVAAAQGLDASSAAEPMGSSPDSLKHMRDADMVANFTQGYSSSTVYGGIPANGAFGNHKPSQTLEMLPSMSYVDSHFVVCLEIGDKRRARGCSNLDLTITAEG